MGRLLEALEQVFSRRGHLFLIGGEPGVGKSRLADEFSSEARARGARVLWARAWEAGGAPPYWHWVQALRSYIRGADPDAVGEQMGSGAVDISQMLPELRTLFPELPEPPPTDPESARFRLFDSTTTFLTNAARGDPVVLVLEDLHAADTSSLLFLRFLAGQLVETSILVVATYRDVELTPDDPLTALVPELSREPTTHHLLLHGLSEGDVATFVGQTLNVQPQAQLVSTLYRETKGNPLFVGETIRLLAAEGGLGDVETSGVRVSVPRGVRDAIERRVQRLSEPAIRALTLGSVLGPEFTFESVRRLGEFSSHELLDVMDATLQSGLVAEVSTAIRRFRYSHDLVRETLYDGIPPARRTELHRRAGEALEQIYGAEIEPHLAELAHHFFEAARGGPAGKALDYARSAGDQAVASLAYEEAARLYRMAVQALELDEPIDAGTLGELLLGLGDAQARAGDLPGARESFFRAAMHARRTGEASQLARGALGYGGRFLWARAGDDPHLIPMLQDALALLGGSEDRLHVLLLTRLACALRSTPDREQSDALSRQALEIARGLNDPSTLGYALVGRYWSIWWPENPAERLELANELIRVAAEANDGERMFEGRLARLAFLFDLGSVAEARGELDLMARKAKELRQPAHAWPVRAEEIIFALFQGDFDRAEELISEELRPGKPATPIRDDASSNQMHLFLLRREQGRLAEIEWGTRAIIDEMPWYPCHRAALACLLLELGRGAKARAVLQDLAVGEFQALYRDSEWLLGMSLASEACAQLGDADSAAVLYGQLLPFAGRHAIAHAEGSVGAVDRYLGLLASTIDHVDDAVRHFDDSIALNARMGARPWTAHSQHDLARLLRRRDGSGDLERAEDLLHSALETARDLRMVALERRVGDLLGGAPASSTTGEPALRPSVFRREGEYWSISFEGTAFRLKDTTGLRHLAKLLAAPGREFHSLDLAAQAERAGADWAIGAARSDEAGVEAGRLGDAGALLDDRAKAAYRARLGELEEELAEAESFGDAERQAKAKEEMDFLARELARAVGLGGRDRVASSAAERARVNVTRAIRSALARIQQHSPELGGHLARTIRTGLYCSYVPDPRVPVSWHL